MTLRIYARYDQVIVAVDDAAARQAFGLKPTATFGCHDITHSLAQLADSVLGPKRLTGGGAVDADPHALDHQAIVGRLQGELSSLGFMVDDAREEARELRATLEEVTRQLTAATEAGHEKDLEIETLHRSLDARHAEVDRLNRTISVLEHNGLAMAAKVQDLTNTIALMEIAASKAAAESEEAQARATWQGMASALRDADRQVDVVTIIAEPVSGEPPAELPGPLAVKALPEPSEPSGPSPLDGSEGVPSLVDAAPPHAAPGDAPPSPEPGPAPETGDATEAQERREKIAATIKAGFIAGHDWDQIAAAASVHGRRLTSHAVRIRAQKMGLKAADREVQLRRGPKSPVGRAIVQAAAPAPALPAVVAQPASTPNVPISRLTLVYGKTVQQCLDEFLSFDDIVKEITAERLTVQDVKKISLELQRLKRDGVTI